MNSTAMPSSAQRARPASMISALAPTSMPRVGSSRISSRGSVASQRASSTFCWLPPDSCAIGVSASRGLDAERLDVALARARPGSARDRLRHMPRRACSARMMFSRTESSATMPSVLRSSGQKPRPRRIALRAASRAAPRLPSIAQAAAGRRGRAPNSSRASLGAARAEQAGERRRPRRARIARSIGCDRPRLRRGRAASSSGGAPAARRRVRGAPAAPARRELLARPSWRSARAAAARRPGTRRPARRCAAP